MHNNNDKNDDDNINLENDNNNINNDFKTTFKLPITFITIANIT